MTSFAFIFGVVPLLLAAGAGAEMRRALGTAVFSGMLGVTFFGIFLTPVFLQRHPLDDRPQKVMKLRHFFLYSFAVQSDGRLCRGTEL